MVYCPVSDGGRSTNRAYGGAARAMNWPKRRGSGVPWLSLPLGGLLALVFALDSPWEQARFTPTPLESAALTPPPAHGARETPPSTPALSAPSRTDALRRGETLGALFAELGLTPAEAHAAAEASRAFVDPRQLRPGATWRAYSTAEGRLERFELALDGRGELRLERDADAWRASFREFQREVRRRAISGRLEGALEESIERAGADGTARLRHGRSAAVGPRLHPRPAAGRPLPHSLRGGLARGRVPRDRNRGGARLRPGRRPQLRGLPLRRRRLVLRRRRPPAAEDLPALAAAVLARDLALHEPPLPSDPQGLPAALRRRLRRAGGHAGARYRLRHRELRRLGRRRRQDGEGPASERRS